VEMQVLAASDMPTQRLFGLSYQKSDCPPSQAT
jgi:hypothetical protein